MFGNRKRIEQLEKKCLWLEGQIYNLEVAFLNQPPREPSYDHRDVTFKHNMETKIQELRHQLVWLEAIFASKVQSVEAIQIEVLAGMEMLQEWAELEEELEDEE